MHRLSHTTALDPVALQPLSGSGILGKFLNVSKPQTFQLSDKNHVKFSEGGGAKMAA